LLVMLAVTAVLTLLVYVLWSDRIEVKAPAEQQREAEQRS
jgi:hypothetical protein